MTRLSLLHTAASLVPVYGALTDRFLPGVECVNLLDETLLRDTISEGRLTRARTRRVLEWLVAAEASGSDAVLVTCSSIGPAVDSARLLIDIPVVRTDEPMIDRAVQIGDRIGVLGTLRATIGPTTELVDRKAAATGRSIRVIARLCQGAFEALGAGDLALHDRLVVDGIRCLAPQVDVVVLAQASMARALAADDCPATLPVLASPEFGVRRIAEILQAETLRSATTHGHSRRDQ